MVEDADVGRDALGHPLAPVEVNGVVAEQHPVEAVHAIHESGQGEDEKRDSKSPRRRKGTFLCALG
jgi:hypothetical protein